MLRTVSMTSLQAVRPVLPLLAGRSLLKFAARTMATEAKDDEVCLF